MIRVLEAFEGSVAGAYTYLIEHEIRGRYVLPDCEILDLEELALMFEDFSDAGLREECGIVKSFNTEVY